MRFDIPVLLAVLASGVLQNLAGGQEAAPPPSLKEIQITKVWFEPSDPSRSDPGFVLRASVSVRGFDGKQMTAKATFRYPNEKPVRPSATAPSYLHKNEAELTTISSRRVPGEVASWTWFTIVPDSSFVKESGQTHLIGRYTVECGSLRAYGDAEVMISPPASGYTTTRAIRLGSPSHRRETRTFTTPNPAALQVPDPNLTERKDLEVFTSQLEVDGMKGEVVGAGVAFRRLDGRLVTPSPVCPKENHGRAGRVQFQRSAKAEDDPARWAAWTVECPLGWIDLDMGVANRLIATHYASCGGLWMLQEREIELLAVSRAIVIKDAASDPTQGPGGRQHAAAGPPDLTRQLFDAVAEAEEESVERLIQAGADMRATDADGQTPLHVACAKGHAKIAELLLNADGKRSDQNPEATPVVGFDEYLTRRHPTVAARDKRGRTALHLAAMNGHQDCARVLVAGGADTATLDSNGRTPQGAAAEAGHDRLGKLLASPKEILSAPMTAAPAVAKPTAPDQRPTQRPGTVEERAAPVTVFTAPLRQHHSRINDLHHRILNLPRKTSQLVYLDHAKQLRAELVAFEKTADDFYRGKTRRGTYEELDLLDQCMTMLSGSIERLYLVSGVSLPEQELDPDLPKRTEKMAHTWWTVELTRTLKEKGVHAILDPFHFKALVERGMANSVGLETEAKYRRDLQDFARSGLIRVDRELAAKVFQRKVQHEIRTRIIRSLVVDISSHTFVVLLAERVLWQLVRGEFWPLMREALRSKNNLEDRVRVSIGTLQESADELNRLGGAAPEAFPIEKVIEALLEAEGRRHATRYLMKDLAEASEEKLQMEMRPALTILEGAEALARHRFLLKDKRDFEMLKKFEEDYPVFTSYRPVLDRIIQALEKDDSPNYYFITHIFQRDTERLVGGARSCPVPYLQALPFFRYVYRPQVEKARAQHLAAGKKPADFNPYFNGLTVPGHQLYTIQYGDRVLYHYTAANSTASDQRDYGARAFLIGLPEGALSFKVKISTDDQREFQFPYTLMVKYGKEVQDTQDRLEREWQLIAKAQEKVRTARTEDEKRRAQLGLLNVKVNHASVAKNSLGAKEWSVVLELEEAFAIYRGLNTPTEITQYRALGSTMLYECALLSDKNAYTLARKVLSTMERYYGPAMPPEPYDYLAGLAISVSADTRAARRYAQTAIVRREALGLYQNAPERKKRDTELLPKEIQP